MLKKCKLFTIKTLKDKRGSLSVIEKKKFNKFFFKTKRIYYLYGSKLNIKRGVHAHKKLKQILFAINGAFKITLDDGFEKKNFTLNSPNKGIYICPMVWREVLPIKKNSILVVLASREYESCDYIHKYNDFLKLIK